MAAIRSSRPAAAGADGKSKPEPPKPVIDTRLQDLVVITGFSGAGKSTAMNVFEDAGYFCVDNLPPEMIRSLVELFVHQGSKVERAAVVSDVRGGVYFEALRAVVDDLDALGLSHHVLFLEAAEQTLVTRYKETRRRHPLAPEGSVAAGVAAERALLAPLREHADLVIDTTGMTAPMLRGKIVDELLPHKLAGKLALTFMSFGFKHGPPREEDLAFDVRFLANPHYVPDLRELTGKDERVVEYIARDGRLDDFYVRLHALLDFLLPQYVGEGKAHLVIAIGCTGGRHRSVAIAEHLLERYREHEGLDVAVAHRDIDKRTRES
ncbi:MAG TPA: RNase adapter RapZ [Solirubrobacteraceae bacterium]|nr:RNase adapter RapZ [Solirubrobacteraceae bacterium]